MKKFAVLLVSIMLISICLAGCQTSTPAPVEATPVTSPDAVIAEAHFVPEQNIYLSFLVQGRVSEILVNKGDKITKDQVLATLGDSEPAVANLAAARLELASAEQALNTLLRSADLATAQAKLNLANAQDAYNKTVWNQKEIDTPQVTNQDRIDSINAAITIAEDKVEKAQKEYDKYSETTEDDPQKAAALSRLANAKLELQTLKNTRNYSYLKPSTQDVLISDGKVEVAKAQMDDAQIEYDRLKEGLDPEKLAVAQARFENAEAQVASAQYALDNYEIKAPFNGIVADINIAVNQQVSPSTWAVALINPSAWYVETSDLTEYDVVMIQTGDTAVITVDALPELKLTGTVDEISLAPESSAGDILYTIRLHVEDPDPLIKWGMTAEVTFPASN